MNAAIGIWAIVLGGWVLPEMTPPVPQPETPIYRPPETGGGMSGRSGLPGPARRTSPGLPGGAGSGLGFGSGATGGRAASNEQLMMPFAPTDPLSAEVHPWGAPTADQGYGTGNASGGVVIPRGVGQASAGSPPANPTLPYINAGPGQRPSPTASPYASQLRNYNSVAHRRFMSSAPPSTAQNKPFSGYQQNPAISPYMNLFRTDNNRGTVDNYYTLVKPGIDQRTANLRTQTQIQRLQTATQNLGVQTQQGHGTGAAGYFMNYGGYYPGFGR
ncbi:MAG: hypothetical protein JXB62_06565 [Pirellulales bacterium]|nr:hypothetical protein [Pirellulales bacterium]